MLLTADVARAIKTAHQEGMRAQALRSARARNLSAYEAELLSTAVGLADYLVAHLTRYSAVFVGEDARIVQLCLSESDDWHGRDIPPSQAPDGALLLEIDRRDWNDFMAIMDAVGHQVCHTELPAAN